MRKRLTIRSRGFTLWDLLMAVIIVAVLLLPLIGWIASRPQRSIHYPSLLPLKAIHQGLVIFAQDNSGQMPGLDRDGQTLPAGLETTGNPNEDGSTAAARYWLLVNGGYLAPSWMVAHEDSRAMWTTGAMTTSHFSYALLRVTDPRADRERRAAWASQDEHDSHAVMVSDRNDAPDSTDAHARNHYGSSRQGEWCGGVVWGDHHFSFEKSQWPKSFTRYGGVVTTNDNLFADRPSPGITEAATQPSANAMMTVTN